VGFVLLYLVLCLIAAAPFGWALSRFLLGRMPAVPDQNRAALYPDPDPTVRR